VTTSTEKFFNTEDYGKFKLVDRIDNVEIRKSLIIYCRRNVKVNNIIDAIVSRRLAHSSECWKSFCQKFEFRMC
jgi:hypothetical protein